MSMAWFAALATGVLASIGIGGIIMAVVFRDAGRRQLSFRVGAIGLTLGGLVLMLGAVAGGLESKAVFGGLLMVLFGTGSNLLPPNTPGAQTSEPPR